MLTKSFEKNSFVFCVLLILFLNFAIAQCGDFICESEEVSSCPSDCEIVAGSDYVPPEIVQDNSAAEIIPNDSSGEMSNQISEETNLDEPLSEEPNITSEQTDLPVNESSFSLNNLFENPFILIGGGVFVLIIIALIAFLLLRKKKSSEAPQTIQL